MDTGDGEQTPDEAPAGTPAFGTEVRRLLDALLDGVTTVGAGVERAGLIARDALDATGPDAMTRRFGRVDYTRDGLDESDLTDDPMDLFGRWYDAARGAVEEPNAMVLATVADGRPSSRTVLLKGLDADGAPGFVLYTNYSSRKAAELAAGARCSLLFPWYALQRQVRVEGSARTVDRATSEAYFATRPRASQLGAWASVEPVPQSGVVADRAALQAAYDAAQARFEGGEVPCPPTWGGYVVVPDAVEFWQGRSGRMHDRLRYRRTDEGWTTERLAP